MNVLAFMNNMSLCDDQCYSGTDGDGSLMLTFIKLYLALVVVVHFYCVQRSQQLYKGKTEMLLVEHKSCNYCYRQHRTCVNCPSVRGRVLSSKGDNSQVSNQEFFF